MVFHRHPALVHIHDEATDAEAEPSPLAGVFGGEKGLEDLWQHLFGDARAIVHHLDEHDITRIPGQGILVLPGEVTDLFYRALHGMNPHRGQVAVLHGVAGVDDQVDQDLHDFWPVDRDLAKGLLGRVGIAHMGPG